MLLLILLFVGLWLLLVAASPMDLIALSDLLVFVLRAPGSYHQLIGFEFELAKKFFVLFDQLFLNFYPTLDITLRPTQNLLMI